MTMNAAGPTVFPVAGARVSADGVSYRTWAPDRTTLSVSIQRDGRTRALTLNAEENGYWSAFDAAGRAGDLYQFQVADGVHRPDVVSRYQPQGVHGPSECIDPSVFSWRCESWSRPRWTGQSIYELHVGTFTPAGTFRSAIDRLDQVRELGVEAIELMPVADFAGDRNWGYDGVALFAPARCYGRPDDLRALVDAAHERGLAVILDVVYNHLGPAGNYLGEYARRYFRSGEDTPWGQGFDVEGGDSLPVRDLLVGNAVYWLDEFRIDGLRLDATHAIPDRSDLHVLAEITAAVHERGGFLIAEDERNHAALMSPREEGGLGFDAAWADDFHHQTRVALTGIRESYFSGYTGSAVDLASLLAHGWTYRGQSFAPWAGRNRGTDCDRLPAKAFVVCIENHDQVGNRASGERLEHLISPSQFRAASMLLCLSPYAPLIFMGQEWAASTPFQFFTDHGGELGQQVSAGRRREFEQHGAQWSGGDVPDPEALDTFTRSKLHWDERARDGHAGILELYRTCLGLRRTFLRDDALTRRHWRIHQTGETLGIRYRREAGDRLLLFTLRQGDFPEGFASSTLELPPGQVWRPILHSEEKRFGGELELIDPDDWRTNGPAAVWLEAVGEDDDATP